jgi:diacylglycerol kinase family enzyme
MATKYAGHAEVITKQYAQTNEPVLVISSSGDGGYHEVINGALDSGSSRIVTGVLPSGNANDHFHALHDDELIDRIARADSRTIDILKVSAHTGKKAWHRYAHSYAGVGLTPQIGQQLTKAKLNRFTESWLVLIHLFRFKPVKIKIDGRTYRYDSLVFSNIGRMSKVLSLADHASVHDGKFEVTGTRTRSPLNLFSFLIKAATVGLSSEARQHSRFQFRCVRALSIQLDGEVFSFAAGTDVTVTCEPAALRCIV